MKESILELIKKRVVIFDGGMGTQLIERGMQRGECPERWNLDRPEDIKEIHSAYFQAGADVVTTNTFGGTPAKLMNYNLEGSTVEINAAAVRLAQSVCPPGGYVAGDMGPTGLFPPPVGKAEMKDFAESYEIQARALADAGVDLIIIETQYQIAEALEALKAARKTGLPVFVTMTFEKKRRGFFTIMGNDVKSSMKALEEGGAHGAGANCSLESSEYIELAELIKRSTSLPVLVQPNAGQPEMENGEVKYRDTPENFARNIRKILEKGAGIVGGCCGTTPDFIRKIARLRE